MNKDITHWAKPKEYPYNNYKSVPKHLLEMVNISNNLGSVFKLGEVLDFCKRNKIKLRDLEVAVNLESEHHYDSDHYRYYNEIVISGNRKLTTEEQEDLKKKWEDAHKKN